MHLKVIGIEAKEGISKKSGRPYDGYFVQYLSERPGLIGLEGKSTFFDRVFTDPKVKDIGGYQKLVGKELDCDFDNKGYLLNFKVL